MTVWYGLVLSVIAQVSQAVQSDSAKAPMDIAQPLLQLPATVGGGTKSRREEIELARRLTQSAETRAEAIVQLEMLASMPDLSSDQRAIVLYELAYCHEQLGQEERALKRLVELSELDSSGSFVAVPLPAAAESSGSADGKYDDRNSAQPLRVKAILRLASIFCGKRQDQLAEHWLSRVRRADLRSPDYPSYALLDARISLDCGRAHTAIEVLQTLECYELTRDQRISVEFLNLQAAMELRDFEQAESHANSLSELAQFEVVQPDWGVTVALRRIEIALGRQQPEQAAELARRAMQQFPSFDKTYEFLYLLARAEIANAQFVEARQHLQAVIASPQAAGKEAAAKAQWMIGETYFLQENFVQASLAYQHVLDVHNHSRWKSMAALQQAKCLEHLGRVAEAIGLYESTKSQFAGSPAADEAALRLGELSGLELKEKRR